MDRIPILSDKEIKRKASDIKRSKTRKSRPRTQAEQYADEHKKTLTGSNRTPAQKAKDIKQIGTSLGPMKLETKKALSKVKTGISRGPHSPEHKQAIRKGHLARLGLETNLYPRNTPEYKQFVKDVRVVTDPQCSKCKKLESAYKEEQRQAGKRVLHPHEVHHQYPEIDFPEYLFDVSKAEVLCGPCHLKSDALLRRDKKNHTGIYLNYRRKILVP